MKDLLNVKELAEYLKVSTSQIYKLTSNRVIPFYKPTGKQLYFRKKEIDEWIIKGKVCTREELINQSKL